MTDFNHIPARHDEINLKLENWARWVRVKPQAWATQPMFRLYQSKARHWDIDPAIRVEVNTLEASEMERAVYHLPEKHRTAIRWAYVFSYVPDARIRAQIGVTVEGLYKLISDGRDMLKNRLRERLVEK